MKKTNYRLAAFIFVLMTIGLIGLGSFVFMSFSWLEWWFMTEDGRAYTITYVLFFGSACIGMVLDSSPQGKEK